MVDIVVVRDLILGGIDWMTKDILTILIVMVLLLLFCWMVMAWALDWDNVMWEMCTGFLAITILFMCFVALDKGVIPLNLSWDAIVGLFK